MGNMEIRFMTPHPTEEEKKHDLKDGCYIAHPQTAELLSCASFEEAMEKWFEGFNLPRIVSNGKMDDFSTAHKRVKDFYRAKNDKNFLTGKPYNPMTI